MKIIKEGKIKPKSNKKTCYKCDSELEYEFADINSDKDGKYIICPICKNFIAVG